jgi:hypothetical protein
LSAKRERPSGWPRRHDHPFVGPLTGWSDHVHFLFASGLVLALLVWLVPGETMPYAPPGRRHCYAAGIAALLLASAVINDLRLSWVVSDVLPVRWYFSDADRSVHRWLLRLLLIVSYMFILLVGLVLFSVFAAWTICLHC